MTSIKVSMHCNYLAIEFLIESFDGASLMDSDNEGKEEPPLRNVREGQNEEERDLET